MKLYVMGRMEAGEFSLSEPYIHIAVYTPGDTETPLIPCAARVARLDLCFHDVARVSEREWLANQLKGTGTEVQPFTQQHAEQIVAFLKAHSGIKHIAVNCDAGSSRSPAIAAAISYHFTGKCEEFYTRYRPNRHVVRLLTNRIGYEAFA